MNSADKCDLKAPKPDKGLGVGSARQPYLHLARSDCFLGHCRATREAQSRELIQGNGLRAVPQCSSYVMHVRPCSGGMSATCLIVKPVCLQVKAAEAGMILSFALLKPSLLSPNGQSHKWPSAILSHTLKTRHFYSP
jgi:hypothetical protein